MFIKGKLVACSVAAAAMGFCSVASAVDTKAAVYGDIRLGYSDVDDNDLFGPPTGGGLTSIVHAQDLHDNQSFWGLKASASQGSVTAFGQYERLLDTDNMFGSAYSLAGGGGDIVRQAFLGVSCSTLGTIAAGTMETAYSKAARRYDPFYNTGVSNPTIAYITPGLYGASAITGTPLTQNPVVFGAGQSFGGSVMSYPVLGGAFVKNQIAYTSPVFGGLSVNFAFFNDEDTSNPADNTNGKSDDDYAAGVDWSYKGFNVGAQRIMIRSAEAVNTGAGGAFNFGYLNGGPAALAVNLDTTLLEAGFSASNYGIGVTLERIDTRSTNANDEDHVQVAGWFGIVPSVRLAATVGMTNDLLAAPGTPGIDAKGFTVGLFHDVVENFTAHVAFSHVENESDPALTAMSPSDTNGWTVGASYKFSLGTSSK